MAIRRYGRQLPLLETLNSLKTTRVWEASVLCGHQRAWPTTFAIRPPKNRADNTTHEALHNSTTTQAWETCVLYSYQEAWPTTSTRKAHCRKCTSRQVLKLTSAQAHKYPGRQVSSQHQQTNVPTFLALETSISHLTKKQIPINGTPII